MSLLIKALQKAEQSKGEAVEAASSAATPAPAVPAVIPAELELAPHHEASTPSLRDESGFDTPEVPPVSTAAQRQAASTVFRAGQASSASSGPSRAVWLAGGGLLLLLLLGGGFYYFLSSLEKPELVAARPMIPTQAPPVSIEAPIETPVTVPAEEIHPAREAMEPVASSAPQPQEQALVQPAKHEDPIVKQEDTVRMKPAVDGAPKVTRNRAPKAAVSEDVLAGYQAYMAGDDAAAARHYRQAAQADPRSVDAWLGVAAVAARQGKNEDATAHYLRVLELEPRNVAAQTGLIGLVGQSDPAASESRLKNLLAQQPEAAFLHAALGNHYAELGQWPTAQQAYFQAFRFDAKNAEYAFNLAVSLDQMGKSELALTHYQRALDLLPAQGGGLDRSQLETRIAQLRQSLNQ